MPNDESSEKKVLLLTIVFKWFSDLAYGVNDFVNLYSSTFSNYLERKIFRFENRIEYFPVFFFLVLVFYSINMKFSLISGFAKEQFF